MGFIMETTPVSELPLLISFEAKSLGEVKFKLAQARMVSLGYAVARYANDGFALLRGDRMFQKQKTKVEESTEGIAETKVLPGTEDVLPAQQSSSIAMISDKDQQKLQYVPVPEVSAPVGEMTLAGPEEDMEPDSSS